MADANATFQLRNGCSACRHAVATDPQGKPAADHGKGFWCQVMGKPVDARDGSTCGQWEYQP